MDEINQNEFNPKLLSFTILVNLPSANSFYHRKYHDWRKIQICLGAKQFPVISDRFPFNENSFDVFITRSAGSLMNQRNIQNMRSGKYLALYSLQASSVSIVRVDNPVWNEKAYIQRD